jgi:hypothetical protein
LNVGSPDVGGDVDQNGKLVVERNSRRHIAERGSGDTHIRRIQILYTEFSASQKKIRMMNTRKIKRNKRREFCPVDYAHIRAGPCNENVSEKAPHTVKTRVCCSSRTTHPLGVNVTVE